MLDRPEADRGSNFARVRSPSVAWSKRQAVNQISVDDDFSQININTECTQPTHDAALGLIANLIIIRDINERLDMYS